SGSPDAVAFDQFDLLPDLLPVLQQMGLTIPTPIQAMAIPPLLAGRDLIGLAQTGTGKTAAFVLPILTMLGQSEAVRAGHPPHALILAPTRELATQIQTNLRNLAAQLNIRHLAVFGGARYDGQIRSLRRGVDIVVATPGRLEDLMNRGAFDPSGITHFVLDEADHMLDLGFYPAIQRIANSLPHPRQVMLFSATMPPEIEKLAARFLVDPVRVKAPQTGVTADKVTQHVTLLAEGEKRDQLCDVLNGDDIGQVLIFVRTRRRADALARFMQVRGFAVDALHGDMRQSIRQKVLGNFRAGTLRAIIATDVAARGIDVAGLGHVINFDMTDTPEAYIHRIGRTGRAGLGGTAISFCAPDEQHKLAAVVSHVGARVEIFTPDGTPVTEFVAERAPARRRQRPPQGVRSKPRRERDSSNPRRAKPERGRGAGQKMARPLESKPPRTKPARAKPVDAKAGKPGKPKPQRAPKKAAFAAPPVFHERPDFGDKPAARGNKTGKPARPRPSGSPATTGRGSTKTDKKPAGDKPFGKAGRVTRNAAPARARQDQKRGTKGPSRHAATGQRRDGGHGRLRRQK
ncbi:MAG: DEAD/DEAH box helicase, partial [Candidatus Puniceispirillum sp.]